MSYLDILKKGKKWLQPYDVSLSSVCDKLEAARENEDLASMSRIIALVDTLTNQNYQDIEDAINLLPDDYERYEKLHIEWEGMIARWKDSLQDGDTFDNFHEKDRKWYRVKIIHRNGDDIKVHYQGWAAKYDQVISLSTSKSFPSGFRVHDKKKPAKPEKSSQSLDAAEESHNEATIDNEENIQSEIKVSNGESNVETVATEYTVTRTGRQIAVTKGRESKGKKANKSVKNDRNEWICGICKLYENNDDSDLILCDGPCMRSYHIACLNFDEAETEKFHSLNSWLCKNCETSQHECFVCDVLGVDNQDVFKCHQAGCGKFYHHSCLLNSEGHFLVPPQLSRARRVQLTAQDKAISKDSDKMDIPDEEVTVKKESSEANDVDIIDDGDQDEEMAVDDVKDNSPSRRKKRRKTIPKRRASKSIKEESKDTDGSTEEGLQSDSLEGQDNSGPIPSLGNVFFKCPYHYCDTCHGFYGEAQSHKYPLFKCIRCPRSFHINCIPPGSRYNAMCLLCPRHPHDILPSNTKPSADPSSNAYAWLWDQMPLPETAPNADVLLENHYRLSVAVREDVNHQPTDFKMLTKLDYENIPNKRKSLPFYDSEDHCNCLTLCDDDCINRILNVECCEAILSSSNQRTNCNIMNQFPLTASLKGFNCGNRQLQYREYAQYEKFREHNRGFGLRAIQDIPDGSLVIEYMGEVINEQQMIERMTNQRIYSPNDHDFYIMELDTGHYVDGKIKGNYSRYINHSCDPNCELQRWVVQGTMRIGIFAIKDIKAGDALSYDYQFDTREENIFQCYCESSNCRGTMAPAKKSSHYVNQFINRMQQKLLKKKDDVLVCNPCQVMSDVATSQAQVSELVLDEEALNDLTSKDRKKLIELGRNEELKRVAEQVNAIQQQEMTHVSKFLPGDGVNEIRNGPLRSTFEPARVAHLFRPGNTRKGAEFLKRRRFLLDEYNK